MSACSECHRDNADEYCLECEHALCSKCKPLHLKRKGFKKHHVDKTYSRFLEKKPDCVIHSKEVVFFCQSCHLLICPTCMLEKHKQHDVSEIEAAVLAKKECIKIEISDLESKSENITGVIDDIGSFEDGYKVDNAIVIKLITSRVEKLKTYMDKRAAQLIEVVTEEGNSQTKRKSHEIQSLQETKELCEAHILKLKTALQTVKDVDLLMSYFDWNENVQLLKLKEINNFQPFPPMRFIEPSHEDEKLESLFGKLEIGHRELRHGDQVRIKSSVAEPINGWGDVTHDSLGIVKGVNEDIVKVDFPEFVGWEGLISEVEISKPAVAEYEEKNMTVPE